MKVLLTGANGRTGRPVLAALASKGIDVRVFIRDSSKGDELKAIGAAEIAVGDMTDVGSISKAVKGCDKVIHIGPPMHPQEVEITQSFIDASKKHAIKHFIYYSVMHPLRREVRHHRLKLEAEENLVESGLPYTILQPSRYMQHLEPIWGTVVKEGIHAMPFNVQNKFSVVDLFDLAEAVAIVASNNDHRYAIYELAGPEPLSQDDMANQLAKVLDRDVKAKAISLTDLEASARAKGMSEDRVEQMVIMNKHYDEHGFIGNPNVITMILGRCPNSYRNYISRLAK